MTMMVDRTDLGDMTDMEVVARLANVDGLKLVDIGCGAGDGSRGLAKMGATVLGLEPDPIQAEKNRDAQATPNVTLIEAGAQDMPADDNSADGVMFFRSLHHVPGDLMDKALHEAARILKPSGFLYVLEPAMYGSHYDMMLPFHDETEVRTQAQQALERTAAGLFGECAKFVYMLRPTHESFENMVNAFTGMSFNGITREMVDVPQVRKDFEAAATKDGFVFEQAMLVNVYRQLQD